VVAERHGLEGGEGKDGGGGGKGRHALGLYMLLEHTESERK